MKRGSVFLFVVAVGFAIYALNHGVYVGSSIRKDDKILSKSCSYYYISGAIEVPARSKGASTTSAAYPAGSQSAAEPDHLYCKIFGEKDDD